MSGAWRDLPFAPAPGARVCEVAEMDMPVRGFDLDGFALLIVRTAGTLKGFVNACPHQHLPLDWRGSNILSADGTVLRCSNHEAGFDAATGRGIDGFGDGCALDPIPLIEVDGVILIAVPS